MRVQSYQLCKDALSLEACLFRQQHLHLLQQLGGQPFLLTVKTDLDLGQQLVAEVQYPEGKLLLNRTICPEVLDQLGQSLNPDGQIFCFLPSLVRLLILGYLPAILPAGFSQHQFHPAKEELQCCKQLAKRETPLFPHFLLIGHQSQQGRDEALPVEEYYAEVKITNTFGQLGVFPLLVLLALGERDHFHGQSLEQKLGQVGMVANEYFHDEKDPIWLLTLRSEQVAQGLPQNKQLILLLLQVDCEETLAVGLVEQVLVDPVGETVLLPLKQEEHLLHQRYCLPLSKDPAVKLEVASQEIKSCPFYHVVSADLQTGREGVDHQGTKVGETGEMGVWFSPQRVYRKEEHPLLLPQPTQLYLLLYLLPGNMLFLKVFLLLDLCSPVPIPEDFGEVFEASQPDFGGFEDVDPDCPIHPYLPEALPHFLANAVDPLGQLLGVLVEDREQCVHESDYHLHTLYLCHKVLLKYFQDGVLVLGVAVLEEGEQAHRGEGQQFSLLVDIVQDNLVHPEGSGVDSSRK